MDENQSGVLPLVCVLCEQTVGVVNASALVKMLRRGGSYICYACDERLNDGDDASIAADLTIASLPPSHYGNLVNQAIAEANNVRA